jgi:hypothetical protein
MTPEQALQILDQASSLAQVTRVEHQKIIEALNTIKKLIEDTKPSQKPEQKPEQDKK